MVRFFARLLAICCSSMAVHASACTPVEYNPVQLMHEVETQLQYQLMRGHPQERLSIHFDRERQLEAQIAKEFCVEKVTHNLNMHRFTATIIWYDAMHDLDEPHREHMQEVTGKYEQMLAIPVLNQRLSRGAIIQPQHLSFLEMPLHQIPPQILTEKEDIIGKAIKTGLFPQTPIAENQLGKPLLIQKNAPVILMVKRGNLTIRSEGIALEDGLKDEPIRVKNTRSNSVVSGIVADTNLVMIASHAPNNP